MVSFIFRYNLTPETLRKLVLIHDNLPRVKEDIKVWKLTLENSKKYTEGTPAEHDDDGEVGEDELVSGSDNDDEPSESLLSASQ